jgi:hypothetical protein
MIQRLKETSPAMAVAIVALIVAVGGTSIAGVATISALSKGDKKQVKKIARNVTRNLAYAKADADARFFTKADADARFLQGSEVLTSEAKATNLIANFDVTGFTDVLTHSVSVPSAGTLLVWGNLTVEDGNSGSTPVESRLLVDGSQVGVEQETVVQDLAFPISFYSMALAPVGRATVGAGAHSIALQAFNSEDPDIAIEDRSITTLFIPS